MKLAVVGGSGFVGRRFLEQADLSDFDVTATYHSDETFPADVESLGRGYHAARHDLTGAGMDFGAFDRAVYMAGNSNHTWALDHADADMAMNATGMARFLQTFHGDLVLLSSGAVYYGQEGLVSPATPAAPLFPYGASKLAAELLAGWAAATGRLRSLKVLRLYYAFGPGEEERRLIRRALTRFGLEGARSFRINGTGDSVMSPMYVTDVARALELALCQGPSGTFDLPARRNHTVREIVETAARVCGVEAQIELVPSSEATLTFHSEQQQFAEAFGFEQALDLEAGMNLYLEHLKRGSAG